jgi:hypothetical protein
MLHMSIPLPCSSGSNAASSSPIGYPSRGILNLPTLMREIEVFYISSLVMICYSVYGPMCQMYKGSQISYLASGSTSKPVDDLKFLSRSKSRILASPLCSQQSAIIAVTRPPSSFSSYAFMKWNVTNGGTSTLATYIDINNTIHHKSSQHQDQL